MTVVDRQALASVQQLTSADFVTISEQARTTGAAVRTTARKAATLSAADRSALDKRVRDAFIPLHEQFQADPSADLHDAIVAVGTELPSWLDPEVLR